MELSNLPRDLVEEISSKLPVTSLRAMRLTCKNLNTSFEQEKHVISEEAKRESMVMIIMDFKVYLMDINLHGPSIKRKGELTNLDSLHHQVVDIFKIVHCDGLLLCVPEEEDRLVVWNPYTTETKWIKPIDSYYIYDRYAIGYEKKYISRSIHKILRFCKNLSKCEIYNLKTNFWCVLDITPPKSYEFGGSMSLKGNTYWLAMNKKKKIVLICFDFTRERFRPRLHLPRQYHHVEDKVALSSVREEQLVVLVQRLRTKEMEIWVTSNIEPGKVSWSKLFLRVDLRPFTDIYFQTQFRRNDFFIDEEKKIVVVMAYNEDYTRRIACIIGENGYIKRVDLGEAKTSLPTLVTCISRNLNGNIPYFDYSLLKLAFVFILLFFLMITCFKYCIAP